MTRLAAQEKMQYYPTPQPVATEVARRLVLPETGDGIIRLLDPCAGDGKPLQLMGDYLKARDLKEQFEIETWGVELHPGRAREAAERLDNVVQAPFQSVNWKPRHGLATVLFLNPPYDTSDHSEYRRQETYFLKKATQALVKDGILIYIINPSSADWHTGKLLYENYFALEFYRFPADLYDRFNQLVVMGRKREKPGAWYSYSDEVYSFQALDGRSYSHHDPPTLYDFSDFTVGRSYRLTTVHSYQAELTRALWTKEEICEALTAPSTPFVPARNDAKVTAVESLRRGHKASAMASGAMGTVPVGDGIMKSRAIPRIEVREYKKSDGTRYREEVTQWDTHVTYITQNGIEEYEGAEVTGFFEKHIAEIANSLNDRMTTMTVENPPTPEELHLLQLLSQDRLRPDGSGESGLYVAQKSSAVAASRALAEHHVAHLVGEMGFGKSTVAAAVIEMDDRYPALISCPPNLIHKWKRELEGVIPGVDAKVALDIHDLQRYIAGYQPGDKLVIISKDSTWPYGSGWEPVFNVRHTLPASDSRKRQQKLRRPFNDALQAYKEAQAELRNAEETERADLRDEAAHLRHKALKKARAYRTCPHCGHALDTEDDYYSTRVSYCPHCDAPLFQWQRDQYGNAKMPFDIYVRDQAAGFFKLFVVDEVHRMKGQATTRGEGFGRMSNVVGDTLTLTGTFFGGVASSIFHLLWRSTPQLIADGWDKSEKTRWIATYGRLKKIYRSQSGSSARNARQWRQQNIKELAGISPTVFKYIFPTMIFRTMADLGVVLPDFNDEIVRLEMTDAQRHDYERIKDWTWDKVQEHGPKAVAMWFQWILSRPNSGFRDETVHFKHTGATLDVSAVIEDESALLPKEQWLVNHCQEEVANGRRVIVYLRQTGTRNIRPRIEKILRAAGINAVQLPDSVGTDKREAWLMKHQPDVLLVNPRRVAVGLDLVMYQDVVFYEIEYSLYVLWQAVRRVWRLGQHRKVKAHYLVYSDTMEEAGLAWIGKKKAAATRMMGDSLAGALVDDSEDNSIVAVLMGAMVSKGLMQEHRDVNSIFTSTAAAMNEQAAEVANRITDSAYYFDDSAPVAQPVVETVLPDEPEMVSADTVETPEIEEDPASELEPTPSFAFSGGTTQQPSLWDSGLWADEEDVDPPEIDLAQAAEQEQLVQASLPGF